MLVSLGVNGQINFASIRWLCTVNHPSFEVDCPVYKAYRLDSIPSHIIPVHTPIPLYTCIIHFIITFQHVLNTASGLLSSGFLKSYLHVVSLPAEIQIGKGLYFQLTWTYMHIYTYCTYQQQGTQVTYRPMYGNRQAGCKRG